MIFSVEKGVTVLVCSRNGEANLAPTLRSLSLQVVSPEVPWEVIFIDNASTDNTKKAADDLWNSYDLLIPYISVTESLPGKENAIDLGLRLSRYAYVIICDDDNWLNEDYVQVAFSIMSENKQIGLLGGFGIPVFEKEKPVWFSTYENSYAVGKQNSFNGEIKPTLEMRFIWGAGSVINKNAYQLLTNAGFSRILTQKKYPAIARCEDMELSQAIQLTGFKLWYDDRLIYRHFISGEKLTWHYLLSLAKSGAMVRPYLLLYSALHILGTKNKNPYDYYRKIWRQYKRNYILDMIISVLRLKNIRHNFCLLLQRHWEADHTDFSNVTKWYFLLGALQLNTAVFKSIFNQVVKLKNNLPSN